MSIPLLERSMIEAASGEESARLAAHGAAWRRFYGHHPRPLKVKPGQPDDNVIVNLARLVVEAGVAFLFGQPVRFELDEAAHTDAETYLAAVWKANRQGTTLQTLALNGAVTGHAFLKIVLDSGRPWPRLVVLDPSTVQVDWAPDDLGDVWRYTVQWNGADRATGRPLLRRQLIARDESGRFWTITDQQSAVTAHGWTTIATARWPHAFPPIVDCQNLIAPNEYYGAGDLGDDVAGLNGSINFVLSNLVRIVRFHAHPKTWGRGFEARDLAVGIDQTIVLPGTAAELRNLEMQGDLTSSLGVYRALVEALHAIARVPEVATGKVESVGPLSGVALEILYQPLIQKTETKRLLYGDLLVELNRRLLALGGYGDDRLTALHWPEVLPADPKAEAEVALIDQQLGASQETLLRRRGYDPAVEAARRETGAAQLGERLLSAFEKGA